jgi:hypothetical protein
VGIHTEDRREERRCEVTKTREKKRQRGTDRGWERKIKQRGNLKARDRQMNRPTEPGQN